MPENECPTLVRIFAWHGATVPPSPGYEFNIRRLYSGVVGSGWLRMSQAAPSHLPEAFAHPSNPSLAGSPMSEIHLVQVRKVGKNLGYRPRTRASPFT